MSHGPQHLAQALSELVALRGLARLRGESQLAEDWKEAAGEKIAARTKVAGIQRGVLQVGVANAALLSELASFHKDSLLRTLCARRPDLRIRDIRFRLRSDI